MSFANFQIVDQLLMRSLGARKAFHNKRFQKLQISKSLAVERPNRPLSKYGVRSAASLYGGNCSGGIFSADLYSFLASPDALEVIVVSYSLTHSLSER